MCAHAHTCANTHKLPRDVYMHCHVAVEIALAISSLQSGKDLLDPNPFHQGLMDEEIPIFVAEHDNNSEDEEEQTKAKPNLDTYKPHVPYSQALNCPKAKVNETDDHVLEAFQKVTIIIALINVIKHIPSYEKFLKGICTPHRSPKRIQLRKIVSLIMMNSLPIKKRDPKAPMITSDIGRITFTRSLINTRASINILPKVVFGHHHVGGVATFPRKIMISRWIGKKTSWYSR